MTALAEIRSPEPSPAASPHLVVRELNLSHAGRILLDDVNLTVGRGESIAVFGPAGAGKAALVDWLAGLASADRGSLFFDEAPLGPRQRAARSKIGLVLATSTLADDLTCTQNLSLAAELMAVPRREARERAADLLRFFGLEGHAEDAPGELPAAVGRRLELARALIHDPSLLLLAEPLRGLDPDAAELTWSRLEALRRARDLSVLICTTRPEIARRCDRVALLDRGRIVANDTAAGLLTRVPPDVIVIEASEPEELAAELSQRFDLTPRLEQKAHRVLLAVDQGHLLLPQLVETFPARRFDSIGLRPADLTDVFADVTGCAFGDRR